MPEFAVGMQPLLPRQPETARELWARIRERYVALEAIDDKRDEAITAFVKEFYGFDLTEFYEGAERREPFGFVFDEAIVTAFDLIATQKISRGSELPPGIGPDGRPRAVNQNQQATGVVGGGGKLPAVVMLPMWNADP